MNPNLLAAEWEALAQNWIAEERTGRNANRRGLLDAPMLQACAPIEGRRFLDCGCGEGRFCRLLAEHGAAGVLGIDRCEPLIRAARELQGERDSYRVASVEDLSFLEEAGFDGVVSYLNQCDLADPGSNTREVFRVLKPGGRFVVANLHPMRSAAGGWHRDDRGRKLHAIVDRYFEEGARVWKLMGKPLTNFHRTLATNLAMFRDAGFILHDLVEPTVTPENLARYPELDDELRVPNFIIYHLHKPSRARVSGSRRAMRVQPNGGA